MPWCCGRGRYYEEEVHHHRQHSRRRHHNVYQNRRHALFTGFLLFAAFILFLLVGLSSTIIKPIYLLEVNATSQVGQPETSTENLLLRFGVWGVCVTSALNPPTAFTNNGDCIGPMLGYTIDPTLIADLTNQQGLVTIVQRGVTILLVLHPVAAGLSLVTLLPVFLTCCVFHNAAWIISLIGAIVTGIVSAVVFAADIALVLVARDQIQNAGLNGISVHFGNGVWMVLAAIVVTWLAVVALSIKVCRCCGYGWKQDHYDPYYGGGY